MRPHDRRQPPTSTPSPATGCRRSISSPSTCSSCPSCSCRAAELRQRTARSPCGAKGAATAPACSRPAACAGAMPSCSSTPTASPTCWCTRWGWCPATGCCCARCNKPMLVACWFAVMKAGGIAVATMPLLRAKELGQIIDKAAISHALCDAVAARRARAGDRRRIRSSAQLRCFGSSAADGLEALMQRQPDRFDNVDTAADDCCAVRLHLRHHRPAEGDDAFPPRPDRGLPLLPAACAARHARRHLHRQPAAGLHLRPRRADAVSDAHRRGDRAAREGVAGGAGRCDRRVRRHGAVHRADLVPRDGRAGARAPHLGAARRHAAQVRLGRRGAAGGHPRAVARRHRHRADRRHRLDRDAAHLHRRRRSACARPGATGTAVPGYRACVLDDDGRPAPRRAPSAGWR